MNRKPKDQRTPSCLYRTLVLLAGVALVVCFVLSVYRPDRPVATIPPASSPAPAFVVQLIRPREGLPLGGLLPPQVFGVQAHLGFDSSTPGARHYVVEQRIELRADEWELTLRYDGDGRVTNGTEVVFPTQFGGRVRRARCRPADPARGTLKILGLEDSGELSGSFDIELPICVDAETGDSLGWPPRPLILHGSFDRLPVARP